MKYIYIFALAAISAAATSQTPCVGGEADGYPCQNVDLWSFMSLNDLGGGNTISDIWGWTDPESGREIAICGVDSQTAFVEITDPANPVLLANLETATTPSLWRDMKVYNNHVYIVSEAGDHGMQIVDLTLLLQITNPPINMQTQGYYDGFGSAHNIVINEASGYAYGVGTDTFDGGLHILDLSNPTEPTLAGSFESDGYTHDAQVVMYNGPDMDYAAGSEIAFCFNADQLAIVDVTVKDDCQLISHGDYPGTGYTHQGWITEDHTIALLGDETDELNAGHNTRTHIFDISDLDNPVHLGYYEAGVEAIDHNMYIKGNFVYQSNYKAGLRILDAVNAENEELYEVGYFDVMPGDNSTGFTGSWSNYCYFPSGNVAVTDISDGLFVLKPVLMELDPVVSYTSCDQDEVEVAVQVKAALIGTLSVSVEGIPGVTATADDFTAPGATDITLSGVSTLDAGSYPFVVILTSEFGEYEVPGELIMLETLPDPPVLVTPADMEVTSDNIPNFYWQGVPDVDSYFIEIAEDVDFVNLQFSQLVMDTTFEMPFMLVDGTYYWHVQSLNNCGQGDFSDPYQFDIMAISVDEINEIEVMIFPNPTDNVVNIRASEALGMLEIYDVSGRMVHSINMNSETLQIDLSTLSSGYYMVRTLFGRTFNVVKR